MDDVISRQAVKELAHNQVREKYCSMALKEDCEFYIKLADCIIDLLPTIQPEPHIGYWKPVGMAEAVGGESAMWGSAIAYHKCSECGEQALEEYGEEKLSDFCPHCGAKMEGTT